MSVFLCIVPRPGGKRLSPLARRDNGKMCKKVRAEWHLFGPYVDVPAGDMRTGGMIGLV